MNVAAPAFHTAPSKQYKCYCACVWADQRSAHFHPCVSFTTQLSPFLRCLLSPFLQHFSQRPQRLQWRLSLAVKAHSSLHRAGACHMVPSVRHLTTSPCLRRPRTGRTSLSSSRSDRPAVAPQQANGSSQYALPTQLCILSLTPYTDRRQCTRLK